MRVFSILLAVVTLSLSLAPCCTPLVKSIDSKSVNVCEDSDCCGSRNNSSEDTPEEKTCGVCSPFYTCGACSGFVFQDIAPYFSMNNQLPSKQYLSLDIFFDSEYFNSKWQPPKIS